MTLAWWVRGLLYVLLIAFCLFYGFAFGLVAPYLLVPFAVPLIFLTLLVFWALPEAKAPPIGLLSGLFFAYFIAMVMWPNYLAIAVPGLPWITVLRFVGPMHAVVLLICLFTSPQLRATLMGALRAAPLLGKLVCAFVLIQTISVGFSANTTASMIALFNAQMNWTAMFFAGAIIFSSPGRAEKFAVLLWAMAVGLGIIGLIEWRMGKAPWVGHIPSFLKINDPLVEKVLSGTARFGGTRRVQTTFTTSLSLSEYLAITMPFLLHFCVEPYRRWIRIAAACTIPLVIATILLSGSRTGVIGVCITFFLYPLVWLYLYRRENPKSFFAALTLILAPILMPVAGIIAYVVPGIRIRILGGGADRYSNQGRLDQLNMGIPKILHAPWGHGIGQGAQTLGWTNMAGQLSIDSYPLRLILEYGVAGFAVYYLLFGSAVVYAARGMLETTSKDKAARLFIPIGVVMVSYILMKIVFAQEDNQPIVFALLGLLCGLRQLYPSEVTAKKRVVGAYQVTRDTPIAAGSAL